MSTTPTAPGARGERNRKMEPRSALFLIALAVLLIDVIVVFVPHIIGSEEGGGPVRPQLATASIQSFPETVTASGTVVPASEVSVNFTTAGVISQIDVQLGQQVSKGAVLASLDNSAAQANVSHAQAALAAAQAVLTAAQAPLSPASSAKLNAALSSTQAVYNQVVLSVKAEAAQDAELVTADTTRLNTDEATAKTDGCNLTQPSNALVCQDLAADVNTDQLRLQNDQSRAATDAADGQLRESQAQSALNQASAAIQAASTSNPSAVATAQAGVDEATAQVQAATDQLNALSVTAPISGTILQINGETGENVAGTATASATLPGTSTPIPDISGISGSGGSSTTSSSNQPFIVIGDPSSLIVGAAFPASDLPLMAPHQTGTITDVSLNGLSVPCELTSIAEAPTTVGTSPVVYATVTPTGSTKGLYPGLGVTVNITVSQANRVLAVPASAIYLVNGVPHVDVWNGSHAVPTAVSTGLQGTTEIEVTSGLSNGQQVVLSAYQGLPDTATTVAPSS
jgi:multidrug efflux pump subunit AcrA (membrane-fusion protein)